MPNPNDHDQLFKKVIRTFFKEFMQMFLPDEAERIDFRKTEFLDKEQFTDSPRGRHRFLDLVAKVGLKDGGEEFILVHVEFESGGFDKDFPRRMFQYFCQLYLRHDKPVIPVALFTDDRKWHLKPEMGEFDLAFRGKTYNHFEYVPIKLRNIDHRRFLESRNPLAYALMCKMDFDRGDMARAKADFLRLLLGCHPDPARESLLFDFVDRYMLLNEPEKAKFVELVGGNEEDYQEVSKTMNSYERKGWQEGLLEGRRERIEARREGKAIGMQRGVQRGLQRGLQRGMASGLREVQNCVIDILRERFGSLPAGMVPKIRKVKDLEQLRSMRRMSIHIAALEDFNI